MCFYSLWLPVIVVVMTAVADLWLPVIVVVMTAVANSPIARIYIAFYRNIYILVFMCNWSINKQINK